MESSESTREISTPSRVDEEVEEEHVGLIDFRMQLNPAIDETREPPNFPIDKSNENGELGTYPEMNFRQLADSISWSDTVPLTHGIHKHPAIFIPHIPRYLIRTFSSQYNREGERPIILDPFSGSGSTGIEAKIAGRDYVGIEINPMSKLVSDVATQPIPYTVIRNVRNELVKRLDGISVDYHEDYDVEFLDNTDKHHWFEESAIEGLTTVRKVIHEFLSDDVNVIRGLEPRERKVIADLDLHDDLIDVHIPKWLTLMIANTVFEVSNADPAVSKAHKSKKMRRLIENEEHPPEVLGVYKKQLDRSAVKLVDLWNEVYQTNAPGGSDQVVEVDGAPNATFHRWSDQWVPPEENEAHRAKVDIQLGDAREFDLPEYHEKVDMAITSPPYINAINYFRGTKLRLFWIQDLLEECSDLDVESLRRSFVGTNSVVLQDVEEELPLLLQDQWTGTWEEYKATTLPDLDKHILRIHNGDLTEAKSRAYITWKFFARDMLQSLTNVYRHLKPGAYFFFIIGENTIGGRRIQSHKFIADIAQNLGKFKTQDSSIQKHERYRLAGMAWDNIANHELFYGRDHGNGVIEREWVVILQKPT